MNLLELKETLPEFAKDVKLNLSSLASGTDLGGLTPIQAAGTTLACAYATKNKVLIEAAENHIASILDETHINAAKSAAAIMAMNNVYYRFVHLVSDKEFGKLPAKLRMNVIGAHGIDKVDFELYSLAVSAINGCGMCIDAHVDTLKKHNVSLEGIQMSIRIAAIMNSVAQVLAIN